MCSSALALGASPTLIFLVQNVPVNVKAEGGPSQNTLS